MLYDAISYIYREKIALENYTFFLRITDAKRHKSCYTVDIFCHSTLCITKN